MSQESGSLAILFVVLLVFAGPLVATGAWVMDLVLFEPVALYILLTLLYTNGGVVNLNR